jgi:hypothetical protein
MSTRAYSLLRTAVAWSFAGIAFNVAQRVLDYVLDSGFQHVPWLAWLAN